MGTFVSVSGNAAEQCDKCWAAIPDSTYQACQTDVDCKNTPGAKSAKCISIGSKKACAAIECASGYMMWIDKGRSMGVCHKQSICTDKGYCPSTCKHGCRPHYIDNLAGINSLVSGVQIQGKAYDYCSCGGFMCGDKDCKWVGSLAVACANNDKKVTVPYAIVDSVRRDATEAEIKKAVMNKYQDALRQACGGSFVDDANSATVEIKETTQATSSEKLVDIRGVKVTIEENGEAQQNAGAFANGGNENFDAENAARDKLEAFFKKIDSDRSVWKNADGSFNAARLASDLTAGVVLGTVGGVVSGVLIKKSQVEKGFDALNCTVNGQKIADWGDEFSVGLRR